MKPTTPHPIAAAGAPYRAARVDYSTQLATTREALAAAQAALAAPPPRHDVPDAIAIERAKLRDGVDGTDTAAELIACRDTACTEHARHAAARAAAQEALPRLLAEEEHAQEMIVTARAEELRAMSEAALPTLEPAQEAYRQAAEELAQRAAELQAVLALVNAPQRLALNVRVGHANLTAFSFDRMSVEVPALGTIGSELAPYAGTGYGAGVSAAGMERRAQDALAAIVGTEALT